VVLQRRMIDNSEAGDERKRISSAKLDALLGLCESAGCRRQALLGYFGEAAAGPCGNCDNCLEPPQTWDATEAAQQGAVLRLPHRPALRRRHLIDVLRGDDNERVVELRPRPKLSTFGVGSDLDERQWKGVFRQLLAGGLVDVETRQLWLAAL
jgi:ATP-dependent DNA helicase RecQ